ncbi:paraquat-inducible protein A [Pararhizobium mangrovi]|nr:paraquat-inducible protein A [Pararhizobium mangrovi]
MAISGTHEVLTAREAGLVACRRCMHVWPADVQRCARCGGRLRSRDTHALQKVWAFWIAGLVCYIPANLNPMLITRTLLDSSKNTIVGGAIELLRHGAIGVALIILVASMLIPIGKFFAVAYLAISVHRGTSVSANRRHRLYEIVEFIGRWSMIDVFVVAILSSLVQFSSVASISPGPAALTFALSVIFTMLSAQAFDTRLLWDGERARRLAGE